MESRNCLIQCSFIVTLENMTHQLLSLRNRIGLMYHYLALNTLVVSLNVTGAFKVKC